MGSEAPGRRAHRAGEPQAASGAEYLRPGRESWRSGHERMLAELARTVDVMETVARVEVDIARTLQALPARDAKGAGARRLRLAREAIRGANTAIERSKHLQRQVFRWAPGGRAAASQLLDRAARVLTTLAAAEKAIADTARGMAGQDDPELAAQRQQLAHEAAAGARRAAARARGLHELAEASATVPIISHQNRA